MENSGEKINQQMYAKVILPLAAPGLYTYAVPIELNSYISKGSRVEVPFGAKKIYAGIVFDINFQRPDFKKVKSILSILDEAPVVPELYLKFWEWIWNYYACEPGEVMKIALPAGLRLDSETTIRANPYFIGESTMFTVDENMILDALADNEYIEFSSVESILGKKHFLNILNKLREKDAIILDTKLKERYKPRIEKYISLDEKFSKEELLHDALDSLSRAPKQEAILLILLSQKDKFLPLKQKDLLKRADTDLSTLKKMEEKGLIKTIEKIVSRFDFEGEYITEKEVILSEEQTDAFKKIKDSFAKDKPALLFGVTGSGKTEVYIELIREQLDQGKQALYLLPEIALTQQIVFRLKKHFGDKLFIYHSKFNENERTEIWYKLINGEPILIIGARSALWLPITKPGIIIIDEEHDSSFKQKDPAPRYHTRDAALVLASMLKAPVLLGSATPSIESLYNTKLNKFTCIKLLNRYGGVEMPEIQLVSIPDSIKNNQFYSPFTDTFVRELEKTISNKRQAIIFQNRRGYAPSLNCMDCGWSPECKHCDVSLNFHKLQEKMQCHYCNYRTAVPVSCPDCGSKNLSLKGFGTERIEEDLGLHLKGVKTLRLDQDVTRKKHGSSNILQKFGDNEADVLVGTQMVTKGLDFENVEVVGILLADQLWQFSEFRSEEKAFQTLVQVAGRAGRKKIKGKVIIQTYKTGHYILQYLKEDRYEDFVEKELISREDFLYPPFCRLIKLTVKHRNVHLLNKFCERLAYFLSSNKNIHVLGPADPPVKRIKGKYLKNLLIKSPKNQAINEALKKDIKAYFEEIQHQYRDKRFEISIDVDPL
ncbi:MAG: primosomal protein N' [Chitinophagaceae bacterium]|nr:MAG: primosomal protein N' [Chitinophagaceae bacterium]